MATTRGITVGQAIPVDAVEPETDEQKTAREAQEAFERGRQAALDEMRALGHVNPPSPGQFVTGSYLPSSMGFVTAGTYSMPLSSIGYSTIYNADGTIRRRTG